MQDVGPLGEASRNATKICSDIQAVLQVPVLPFFVVGYFRELLLTSFPVETCKGTQSV